MLAPATNPLDLLRNRLIAEHAAVADALTTALNHAMNAGDVLIEAKAQLDHGGWLPWLDSCGISVRLAQRYVRLARHRSTIEANATSQTHLSVSGALALLANPKKEAVPIDLSRYTLDPLQTMLAEMEYAHALVREAFPERDDYSALRLAHEWRATMYEIGRWPDAEEISRLLELEKARRKPAPTPQTKKLSATTQWMKDHPSDLPCPTDPDAAKAWRKARGIGMHGEKRDTQRKYAEALIEKRAAAE